uniref:Uncharacterized protein n=1 Tax=Oryza glumipatula TaxID=40148 RepID=A0A0D9Z4M4_9ORYZ
MDRVRDDEEESKQRDWNGPVMASRSARSRLQERKVQPPAASPGLSIDATTCIILHLNWTWFYWSQFMMAH